MGILLSYLWPSTRSAEFDPDPALDQVDPSCGLSERQKRVIRENWAVVQQDVNGNGIRFFVAVFKKYPAYLKHFAALKDLRPEQLDTSKKLAAHGKSVLFAVASMVDSLDDVECLTELLLKTGINHIPRKITIGQFENVLSVLGDYLGESLGPNVYTPFAKKAWEETFKVMTSIISKGLNSSSE